MVVVLRNLGPARPVQAVPVGATGRRELGGRPSKTAPLRSPATPVNVRAHRVARRWPRCVPSRTHRGQRLDTSQHRLTQTNCTGDPNAGPVRLHHPTEPELGSTALLADRATIGRGHRYVVGSRAGC